MASQRDSLEVTIEAAGSKFGPEHEALLSFCRLMADQLDEAGSRASARLTGAYLSGLKDVGRVLADAKEARPSGGTLASLRLVANQNSARKAG